MVPVVLQMATATQVRTMRQVSDDRHADLRVPQQVIATIEAAVASGALDPADRAGTTRFLWRLHRTFAEPPELHDGLASGDFSGVANRSQRDRQLALAWERHRQEPRPRSLLMLDLDHFKPCNDTGPCRAAATAGKGGGERLC